MIRLVVCVVCVLLSWSGVAVAAETDTFTINTTITGADTLAPSVPANVSAVATAVDTIELTWDASTDNFGVDGYHVWRDGMQIATTTMTNYVDAGLASSTLYSYYITSFDASGNESASSTVVSATTLSVVAVTRPQESTQIGTSIGLSPIAVSATPQSLTLSFTTERYTYSEVEWRLGDIVLGVVRSGAMNKNHSVFINGLQADTEYDITVRLHTGSVENVLIETLRAKTSKLPDTTPPANPRNFSAEQTNGAIYLEWQNPADVDFSHVRLVRSTQFYPLDTVDGWVVYEGDAQAFTDVVTTRPVYYTLFAIDKDGNVSSGALLAVRTTTGDISVMEEVVITEPVLPPDFVDVPAAETSWPIYIQQYDRVGRLSTSTVFTLAAGMPFTVYVPTTAVPAHLKSIVATLTHPDETAGSFQFLLRRNADGTAYEAVIGALPDKGSYQLTVRYYDFVSRTSGIIEGTMMLTAQPPVTMSPSSPYQLSWWWALVGLVLLLCLRIIYRRYRSGIV